MTPNTYRFETLVGENGKLDTTVPRARGTKVEVVVLTPPTEENADLTAAATTSLEFWDHPWDDEDWNNA